ncbi:MAG TPA: GTP-binding protein [Thermoplasmata archaeon]|nr:GTP-binding protein [Thermoplasmata archaeon]
MPSKQDLIKELEEEIRRTDYNKATQHHIGKLKAKIAKLKQEIALAQEKKGGGGGYHIKKSGHATVALVGLPSVGKSTLLNVLTGARSEVADYQFTTLNVVPGVLHHRHAKIQLLDLPGIIKDASKGRGRGKEVLAAVRNADLILYILEPFNPAIEVLERELYEVGIRSDAQPPDVKITKTDRGGIVVNWTKPLTKLDEKTVVSILKEYGVVNANVVLREDVSDDQLIDVLAANRVYIPTLPLLNKIDLADEEVIKRAKKKIIEFYKKKGIKEKNLLLVSAKRGTGIEELKDTIYKGLNLINIYLKPVGGKADLKEPLVVKYGATVGTVCDLLHRDFRKRYRYGVVIGKSVKFPGQMVGLDHKLEDNDILTIVTH